MPYVSRPTPTGILRMMAPKGKAASNKRSNASSKSVKRRKRIPDTLLQTELLSEQWTGHEAPAVFRGSATVCCWHSLQVCDTTYADHQRLVISEYFLLSTLAMAALH